MQKIIETHCHLDYLKQASLEEILKSSKEAGIEKIITIAVEPDNFNKVKEIAEAHTEVYFSQGIHPHDAKLASEDAYKIIKERTTHPKMVAVGEIGLDYYYNNSPKEIQLEAFKKQLEIASNSDKPVIIHSRDAEEDTISVLKEFSGKLNRKGVIHSFTSKEILARFAIENDFYLGFNGIITFKNAKEVRDVVAITPIEKILLETDSPFLTPVPHRGKENAPFYLPFIAEKIAEIKGISVEEVRETCYQNSLNLFGL